MYGPHASVTCSALGLLPSIALSSELVRPTYHSFYLSASNLFNRLSITNIRWKKIIQGGWQQKLLTNTFKPFGGGAITVWRILDNPVGKGKAETPEPRQRQLRDEAKSCGNQPAHIRVINRR